MIFVSFPQKEYNPLFLQCLLSDMTSCTPTKSNLYLVNSLATVVSDPDLHMFLAFHLPNIMSLFQFLSCINLQPRLETDVSVSKQGQVLRWDVSTSPSPHVGRPFLAFCPRLLFKYIRSYPPHWRPFLLQQPEEAPYRGERDPLIIVQSERKMHDQTHRRRVHPTIKEKYLEAKAFCSMFSELGLVMITEKVLSVHFERQRRMLHI